MELLGATSFLRLAGLSERMSSGEGFHQSKCSHGNRPPRLSMLIITRSPDLRNLRKTDLSSALRSRSYCAISLRERILGPFPGSRKCGPTRGNTILNTMDGGDGVECLICHGEVEICCLSFWGAVICGDCESRLVEQAIDEPGYDVYVNALRLLWQRKFVAVRDRHLTDGEFV